MEILRDKGEAHMLPHHFMDFVLRKSVLYRKLTIDESIKIHTQRLSQGVEDTRYLVPIPQDDPLRTTHGSWIFYSEDVHGDKIDEVNKLTRRAFRKYFRGNPEELIKISLLPDAICDACAHGVHCENSLKDRMRGASQDNYPLEYFYAWNEISRIFDEEWNSKKMQKYLDSEPEIKGNARSWLRHLIDFREMSEYSPITFGIGNYGRVESVEFKRGVIRLFPVMYFLLCPNSGLLWRSRADNALVKKRDVIKEWIDDGRMTDILDILEITQSIYDTERKSEELKFGR